MLASIQGKMNIFFFLKGMQTGIPTIEISADVPEKS